ncbi:MAG: hypothetical protein AAB568_01910 [Patescibacteria group bacterium]
MQDDTQPIIRDNQPAQIEEPPLKNRKSCLWRGLSHLFLLTIFIVIIFGLIAWLGGPRIKRMATVPQNFPTDIPLYHFTERSTIQFMPGQKIESLWSRLILVPKFLAGPLILKFNPDMSDEEKHVNDREIITTQVTWEKFQKILEPVHDQKIRDYLEITWEYLDDKPKTIYDFYKRNLVLQEYKVTPAVNTNALQTFTFQKGEVNGEVSIQSVGDTKVQTTKAVILKVTFPPQR